MHIVGETAHQIQVRESTHQQLVADSKTVFKLLPAKACRKIRELFHELDADGSGTVSRAERYTMSRTELPEASSSNLRVQIRNIMAVVDADRNGELDFDGFIAADVCDFAQPFCCDSCDRFLVLDMLFFACALCWENVQKGRPHVRCDGASSGCFIYCPACVWPRGCQGSTTVMSLRLLKTSVL